MQYVAACICKSMDDITLRCVERKSHDLVHAESIDSREDPYTSLSMLKGGAIELSLIVDFPLTVRGSFAMHVFFFCFFCALYGK